MTLANHQVLRELCRRGWKWSPRYLRNLDVIMVSQIGVKYSANIKVRPAGEEGGTSRTDSLLGSLVKPQVT
jgi:hypothetical protein